MATLGVFDDNDLDVPERGKLAGLGQDPGIDSTPADPLATALDSVTPVDSTQSGFSFDSIVSGAATIFRAAEVATGRVPATPATKAAAAKAAQASSMTSLLIPGIAVLGLLMLMKRR